MTKKRIPWSKLQEAAVRYAAMMQDPLAKAFIRTPEQAEKYIDAQVAQSRNDLAEYADLIDFKK